MLIAGVMGQNCMKFLPMCLESLKGAGRIVYIDGGSEDSSIEFAKSKGCEIIESPYNQEDLGMNGKQRNKFLQYIKDKYPEEWCIFCDADEVIDDLSKIKEFIQEAQPGLYHVKMRHFIGDLGHEDSMQQTHFALARLFKISEAGKYPEIEHPILFGENYFNYIGATIFHLGYINGIFDIKKKYDNHSRKSNMHTPEYLYNWNKAHVLGIYPTKPINPLEIPKVILDNFGIDKDELYFANRRLNINNFVMVKNWMDYFNAQKVLDVGCGLGNYGVVLRDWYKVDYKGIDISDFAVKLNPYKLNLEKGNILDYIDADKYDIVLCLDILEHLKESDLDKALENIKYLGSNYIFSIPFIGDPNLTADLTHLIHQTKDWWTSRLSTYFEIRDCPESWAFSNQLLLGKRK